MVPSELAQAVVDGGAVPLLVLCVQEPEMSLKRVAASALSDICKHTPELAQTVVDAGAIAHLAQMILNPDAKLKVGGRGGGRAGRWGVTGVAWRVVRDGRAVAGGPWRVSYDGEWPAGRWRKNYLWWSMMIHDKWSFHGRWSLAYYPWQMVHAR